MKIYAKTVIILTGVILLFGIGTAWLSGRIIENELTMILEEQSNIIIKSFSERILKNVLEGDILPVRESMLELVGESPSIEYVYIIGFERELFMHTFESGFPADLEHNIQDHFREDSEESIKYTLNGIRILEIKNQLIEGLPAYIFIGMNESILYQRVMEVRLSIYFATLGMVLLGIYISWYLNKRVTNPLNKLTQSMLDYGKGNIREISNVLGGGWEVQEISSAFNGMIKTRQMFENKLLESEVKFRDFIQGADDLIIQINNEGKILFVNIISEKIFGWKSEECVGKSILEYVLPDDRKRTESILLNKSNEKLDGTSLENRVIHKDGKISDMLWTINYHYDENGELLFTNSIARDITKRKKIETSLLVSENRFEAFMNHFPGAAFIKDEDGKYVYTNLGFQKEVKKTLGIDETDWRGKYDADFLPEQTVNQIRANDEEVLSSGQLKKTVEMIPGKHGMTYWLSYKFPIVFNEGKEKFLASMSIDITEQKKNEEAIKVNEERYKNLFVHSPISIWEEDFRAVGKWIEELRSKGVKNLRKYLSDNPKEITKALSKVKIIDVNEATLDLYEANSKEELIKGLSTLLSDSEREMFSEELIAIWDGKENISLETNGKTLKGKNISYQVAWTAPKINGSLDLSKVIVALQNITEQKMAVDDLTVSEFNLKKAQEMAHVGSWDLDLLTDTLNWSDEVYRIFGLTPQEFGATYEAFVEAIHPDDREMVNEAYTNSVENNTPYEVIHRVLRPDGEVRIVREKSEEVLDRNGKAIRSVGTVHDITELEETTRRFEKERNHFDKLLESIGEVVFIVKFRERVIERVNSEIKSVFGYESSECVGQSTRMLCQNEEDFLEFGKALQEAIKRGDEVVHLKQTFMKKNGKTFPSEVTVSFLKEAEEITHVISVVRDVSESQQSERALREAKEKLEERVRERTLELEESSRKIKESLEEKEVLLKEIHHRVKNNLQLVSSLLNLQANSIDDEETIKQLMDSKNRIMSMSLIHENIYQSENLSDVNIPKYLKMLAENLMQSYVVDRDKILLETKIEDITLDINRAIPLGLIITELVTNSIQHAFGKSENGKINIKLHAKRKNIELIVRDNGSGISKEYSDGTNESLGLKLVHTLIAQLQANLKINRKDGTEYKITFKM